MDVVELNGSMAGVGKVDLNSQIVDRDLPFVEEVSEHIDLRPVIANRSPLGPDVPLNVMDEQQVDEVAVAIEEGGRRWMLGQAISSDRQYRSAMTDFNLMAVDSPKYGAVKQSLEEYWDRRGLGRGQVAAVTDVRRARAYQLMAEIGDEPRLDEGQEREVDAVLGQGSVDFYKGLSQEEKDQVLVDGYVDSFVGGSPALSRVYLAERIGLKTDEVGPMAAELRRQAGVGRSKRDQVRKDLGEVWYEMMRSTSAGQVFPVDPRDHPGRSPEFLAAAGQMAESQTRAAAFIKEMAYGEDGRSPKVQGMQTGIGGLRSYGYSKYEDGRWVVELAKLHKDDPRAYEFALGAIAALVEGEGGKSNWAARTASHFAGMFNEAFLGSSRWAEDQIMGSLEGLGLLRSGEDKFHDELWAQRVNKVAQDIQQIRMGQFQAKSENGFLNFMEEASGVTGGSVAFMMTGGLGSMLEGADTAGTKYFAQGKDAGLARYAGLGEGAGMWAANIWGLGKGGKLVGNAYDKLMNWAGQRVGMKGVLRRALDTDRFWGRGPLFVGLEGGVLHAQTVMEPYVRSVASNLFTGGQGKSWDEADAEAREAMTWRNFLVALPMSMMLGYGRYARNSPFRAAAMADERIRGIKQECAESPEAMKGLHFTDAEIKAVLNAKDDQARLRLFDLTFQQRVADKLGDAVGDHIAVLMTPDVPLVQSLMVEGVIPHAVVKDGWLRVYGAEAVTFSSDGKERGSEMEAGGKSPDGFIDMDLEAGYRFLTTKVQEWAMRQDFTLKNGLMEDATVDYFAQRCEVDFKGTGVPMTYRALQRMADDALLRIDERNKRAESLDNNDLSAQDEDLMLAVLPNNFRDRVEVALKRGEVRRAEGHEGEVTAQEVDDVLEGVAATAMNYELAMGKRIIRYYEGDATFLDIVEELAELYVKGEMAGGRDLLWFSNHLLETQTAFRDQGVKNWKLMDESMSGDKMAVVEGMSKLMQAVYMGEFQRKDLPVSVRRFLDVAAALCRKVADMVGLAGAFRRAVDTGAVRGDFASFVYDAVGADFARSRADMARSEFEKGLDELRDKPNRVLGYYADHLFSIEQYGIEAWKFQMENEQVELSGKKDLVNRLGEKWKSEFRDAGFDVIRMVEVSSVEDVKAVVDAVRRERSGEGRVHDFVRVMSIGKRLMRPSSDGSSFSIKERLNEMGKNDSSSPESLPEVAAAWKKQLEDYVKGCVPDKRRDLRVGPTPAVLRMLGADAYDLVITPIVLDKVTEGKHAVPVAELERLPEALSRPLAVFESGTQADSLVALTELKEGDHNVVVAVHLNASGGRVQVNRIASVYGKDNPRALLNTPLLFLDKKKADAWLTANRLQLPAAVPSNHRTRKKIMSPKDVFKWKDGHGLPSVTFALRDDLLSDMRQSMERSRSDAVRDYWAHVMLRVEKEGKVLDTLFSQEGDHVSDVRQKIAESRSIMKAAIATLPEKARVKLRAQEAFLDYLMDALVSGKFDPHEKLTAAHLMKVNRKMNFNPEFFDDLIGQHMDDLLANVYRRCGDVINLYVRDELFSEVKNLIANHEAVIDEKTRKFKVSRLGAGPTEFLRRVIKPAFFATAQKAEYRVNDLMGRVAAIETALNPMREGKIVTGADQLMIEKERLVSALNWWMNFSAGASADVNRMLDIHEALTHFIYVSADAWAAQLKEKVDGWKRAGKELQDELPVGVDQRSIHRAEMEVTDLGVDSKTGKRKRGVMLGWLDNPVRFLQRLCDGSGKKFLGRFKTEFIGAIDQAQFMRAEQVERVNRVLKKMLGTKSEMKVNEFLRDWDQVTDLGLSLSEKGVRRTRLTIDQAAALLEKRKENPWYGVDNYSQRTIDLLREEYEAWGRGENKARKWFEVEEWFDRSPTPMPMLSRDQALYVLMCMEQPNVFDSRDPDFVTPLRRRGWNEGHKAKLEEYVGESGMALKDVLFEEYALLGDKIRPLYENRYGVPFSKRRNYSPLRWMVTETGEDSDLASIIGDDGMVAVGRSDGFFSVRKFDHQRYLDTTQGALKLFWKHHASASNWVSGQEVVERYKGILSDAATAQKLFVNLGGLDYRGVQVLINRLEHGGRDAVAELDAAERLKNDVMNARALSVILGQITSYLKQTTAVFNALHGCDLSISEWVHGMARVIGGKSVVSVKDLFNSDLFQARKDGFMYSVLLGYKKQLGGRVGAFEQIANHAGKVFGWLDSGSNAISFAAAFDHYVRQAQRQGMSKPEAMEYARDVIEEGLATSQPINWSQMPKMLESTKGIFSAEWFLMSETLQRGATVMNYLSRGKTKLAVRSWLLQGFAMQALGYLINNVMRPGGDDDERKDPLNYLPGIFLGPLNGLPFIGRLTDEATDWVCDAFGLEMQSQSGVMGSQIELTLKDVERLAHILEADSWKDVRQQSRSVSTLASLTAMLGAWKNPRGGAVLSVSLGVATMANYLKHLAGMAERWFGEE